MLKGHLGLAVWLKRWMNGREMPFYTVLHKDIGVAEALKVDSPWFVLFEWKTYCKVRGFYLPKVIIFFI